MDSGNNHSGYNWTQQQSAIPQNPAHDPLSVLLNALAHVDPDYQEQQQSQPTQGTHHNDPSQTRVQSTFNSGQQLASLDTMSTLFSHDHIGDQGSSESPGHPRPLATKPLYKKRVIVPVVRPDGIIRRSGAAAEKQQRSGSRPSPNFYDQSKASTSDVVDDQEEQGPPPAKRSKVAKAAASITGRRRHRKGARPKRTPREFIPPREPKPPRAPHRQHKEPKPQKPRPPKAPPLPPVEYAPPALTAPPNRKLPIETLAKKQEYYRDKIMKMATRPMPPRELHALVEAELNEEEKTLREIYSSLHKELLKLQLEEGVFLNMLRMAAVGGMELDISDFKKVKRRRRSDAAEVVMGGAQGESNAHPIIIPPGAVVPDQGDHDVVRVETQEEGTQGKERQERQIPALVQDEYEDEDDNQDTYEDDDDAFGEDWVSMPTVHLPAETYSVPGIPDMISSEGRPSSSAFPSMTNLRETDHEPTANTSLNELKKLIVARGKQRTLQAKNKENDMELDEDSLYALEDDDEMLLELDDDGDDELLQSLNREGGSKVNIAPSPDQGDKDASGTESEDYGDEDDEEGEDEDEDEEDEDRAREALSRMLSQYGDSSV